MKLWFLPVPVHHVAGSCFKLFKVFIFFGLSTKILSCESQNLNKFVDYLTTSTDCGGGDLAAVTPRLRVGGDPRVSTILSSADVDNGQLQNDHVVLRKVEDYRGKFTFFCVATHPVQVIYPLNYDQVKSLPLYGGDQTKYIYTDFLNCSTYLYVHTVTLYFEAVWDPQEFSCRLLSQPSKAIDQTIEYKFLNDIKNVSIKFITPQHPQPSSPSFRLQNDKVMGDHMDPKNLAQRTTAFAGEQCEVVYFYKEIQIGGLNENPVWQTYAFACQFRKGSTNGSAGTTLIRRRCSGRSRCQLLRTERQKNCWKKWQSDADCANCTWSNEKNFWPFYPVCHQGGEVAGNSATLSAQPWHSFVSFGLPLNRTSVPRIFFSDNEVDPDSMIYMTPFNRLQRLNTVLQVECQSSAYYGAESFQFAVLLEGQSQTSFISVSPDYLYDPDLNVFRQKMSLQLNDTRITTIYCLGAVQTKFGWLKASRPVKVLDFEEYYNRISTPNNVCTSQTTETQSSAAPTTGGMKSQLEIQETPPSIDIKYGRIQKVVISTGKNQQQFVHNDSQTIENLEEGVQIIITCRANYPIDFLHEYNLYYNTSTSTVNEEKNAWMKKMQRMDLREWTPEAPVLFQSRAFSGQVLKLGDLKNDSTCEYRRASSFQFMKVRDTHWFRCQSIQRPCDLHQSIRYTFDPKSSLMTFQAYSSSSTDNSNGSLLTMSKEHMDDSPDGGDRKEETCEADFYFEQIDEFPFYTFRCQFQFERAGHVHFTPCGPYLDCQNAYRNHRQPATCWHPFVGNATCVDCPTYRPKDLHGFVATCFRNDIGQSYTGSFAFFDISKPMKEKPGIYFSLEDVKTSDMIWIEQFDPFQVLGASLNVRCRASASFTSRDLYFAQKRKSNPTLDFFLVSPRADDETIGFKNSHAVSMTIKLVDEDLEKIFCFSGSPQTWLQTPWMNFSRSVHVHRRTGLRVWISEDSPRNFAGTFESIEFSTETTRPSSFSFISFEENAANATIYCYAQGYPPATTFTWNDKIAPSHQNDAETGDELVDSLRWAVFQFPTVVLGHGGSYACEASYKHEPITRAVVVVKVKVQVEVEGDKTKTILSIVGPLAAILILIVFGILFGWFWRRSRRELETMRNLTSKEKADFLQGIEIGEMEDGDENAVIYALAYDRSLEIPEQDFEIDESSILGAGEFGVVLKGQVKRGDERMAVAVKMARSNIHVATFRALLLEIKILGYLGKHENVLFLVGACTTNIKRRKVMAAVEYCALGDLHNFLHRSAPTFKNTLVANRNELPLVSCSPTFHKPKSSSSDSGISEGYVTWDAIMDESERPTVSTLDLFKFSSQISNGMAYLTEKKVIHADLATRNIFLTESMVVKIGDFGLSRRLGNYSLYVRDDQMLKPWLWMSIEALTTNKLSIQSDVWSYGITLWEIFSLAHLPYGDCNLSCVQDLIHQLNKSDHVMDCPPFANLEIYNLMKECWRKKPEERPSFEDILLKLAQIVNELD